MTLQYAECRYAECRDNLNVKLSVVMLSVVMQNIIMLSVVAPFNPRRMVWVQSPSVLIKVEGKRKRFIEKLP
jgi:hypothetical protein